MDHLRALSRGLAVVLLLAVAPLLSACGEEEEKGAAEQLGKTIDETLQKAGEKAGEAMEQAGEKAEELGDKAEEALKEAEEAVKDATQSE